MENFVIFEILSLDKYGMDGFNVNFYLGAPKHTFTESEWDVWMGRRKTLC